MIRLEPRSHAVAMSLYRAEEARFPLIGAVLLDEQEGAVFVDDVLRPGCAYVEHAFGFSQILGQPARDFESALERYLLIDRNFLAPKVRLYALRTPHFLSASRYDSLRSLRQRFVIDAKNVRNPIQTTDRGSAAELDPALVVVNDGNVEVIEQAFGVTRRFWRSPRDFVARAHALVVTHRGEPASICYAAADVDSQVEIDVFTRPEFQRLGLGARVATAFVRRCLECGLEPLWDCFANNTASVQLCRSIGFLPRSSPYSFFTINR